PALCRASCSPLAAAPNASRMLFRVLLPRGNRSFARQLFFQQLFLIKIVVIAALRNQFIVSATLDDHAFAQNDNFIGVADGGTAMRNQDSGAAARDIFQSTQDFFFRVGIHAGKGVVEDQYLRISQNSAGESGALLLSTGKSDSALPDHRLVL